MATRKPMKNTSDEHASLPKDMLDNLAGQLKHLLAGEPLDPDALDELAQSDDLKPLVRMLQALEGRLAEIGKAAEKYLLKEVVNSRQLEQTLHRARIGEGRSQTILDMAVECIITTDSHGIIQFFNRASERLFGFDAAEVVGRNVSCLMPEPYKSAHDRYMQRYLETLEPHIVGIGRAIVAQRKDGSTFPAELAVNPFTVDDETYFVGTLHDISAHLEEADQLRLAASRDPLTGLLNRHGLLFALQEALDQARHDSTLLGLIFIDLDNFKPVNDTYGHAAGDECLRAVARRLIHALKPDDLVARLGGDEYVVVLRGPTDARAVQTIAQRILKGLSEPINLTLGGTAQLGASLGLSLFPRHGDTVEQLLEAADKAMYATKYGGKQGVTMKGD